MCERTRTQLRGNTARGENNFLVGPLDIFIFYKIQNWLIEKI